MPAAAATTSPSVSAIWSKARTSRSSWARARPPRRMATRRKRSTSRSSRSWSRSTKNPSHRPNARMETRISRCSTRRSTRCSRRTAPQRVQSRRPLYAPLRVRERDRRNLAVRRRSRPRAPERGRAGSSTDGRVAALEEETRKLKGEIAKRDAAAKTLQQRADALAAAAKKFERELTAARGEAKGGSKTDVARLEAELDKAREEVAALTGEKDLLREERDELQKQAAQAQAAAKQNEGRAIKAYQKLKGDEKLKDRTRKALQIALALLDDGTVDVDSESEKESLG